MICLPAPGLQCEGKPKGFTWPSSRLDLFLWHHHGYFDEEGVIDQRSDIMCSGHVINRDRNSTHFWPVSLFDFKTSLSPISGEQTEISAGSDRILPITESLGITLEADHLQILLKCRLSFAKSRASLRFCISNEFPVDAEASGVYSA